MQDPTLLKGTARSLEYGQPARATSVSRTVYDANGKLLHEDTWYSSYAPSRRSSGSGRSRSRSRSPRRSDRSRRSRDAVVPGAVDAAAGRSAGLYPSAVATASANQAGTRVGRRVAASTVAWPSSPSATRSPLALDRVLVAEARAADVDAARPDPQPVVEVRGAVVAHVDRGRQRLDPLRLDRQIAAGVLGEVRDAGDLEPDHERGVVRDPLRVRLGEAHEDLGREVVALHRPELRTNLRRRS